MDPVLNSPKFSGVQWLNYCKRESATGFDKFKNKVFEKDNWRCFHCGFVAKKHMKVMNFDGNFLNNKLTNLYTACPLCFWSSFIEHANGGEKKRGVLIYMPEITQSDLNGLMHSIFCAVSGATVQESSAEDIHKSLKIRAKTVEDMYGEGKSDPSVFGQMVLNSINLDGSVASNILTDIRFLPSMLGFVDEVKDWTSDAAATESQEQL